MKKRLKDFLTGVGSVLEIYPNAVPGTSDLFHSDLERIGSDFNSIGKDISKSIVTFSRSGGYQIKSRALKKSEKDLDSIKHILRMSSFIENCRSGDKVSSRPSVATQEN